MPRRRASPCLRALAPRTCRALTRALAAGCSEAEVVALARAEAAEADSKLEAARLAEEAARVAAEAKAKAEVLEFGELLEFDDADEDKDFL